MTRKDYILIAKAIRESAERHGSLGTGFLIGHLADALKADNPRFDRERFVHACNPNNDLLLEG